MNQEPDLSHPPSFEARLRAGLEHLATDTAVRNPGEFDPRIHGLAVSPTTPRRWAPALAVAATIAVVAGLTLVTRDAQPRQAVTPAVTAPLTVASTSPSSATTSVQPFAGAVMFDTVPAELAIATFTTIDLSGADLGAAGGVRRWYTSSVTGGINVALTVDSIPTDRGAFPIPNQTETLTIQGVNAQAYDHPSGAGRSISLTFDDTNYLITGFGLDSSALITAAEHLVADPAGRGGVIDPAGLPDGTSERATGDTYEVIFIPDAALSQPMPVSYWTIDDTTVFWVTAFSQPAAQLDLHCYGAATCTPAEGAERPAFLVTYSDAPGYRAIVWNENDITYVAASTSADADTLIRYANHLRTAAAP